jgi:hypothetical protein
MNGKKLFKWNHWALVLMSICILACSSGPTNLKEKTATNSALLSSLISTLVVNDTANAANWSIQSSLAVGDNQYGDRAYTLTTIPSAFVGASWIETANASKAYTGTTVATFLTTENDDVYIAFNTLTTPLPSWLSTYTNFNESIVNSEATPKTFELYKQSFVSGTTVSLGNAGNTTNSFYTVIVLPTPVVMSSGPVTNLIVNDTTNEANWSIQSGLAVGNDQYGDRAYTLSVVPSTIANATWIRTANASKAYAGTTVATFTVTGNDDVYIAFNDLTTTPTWLSSIYTDSGMNLVNSEATPKTFSLFKHSFVSGSTVTLGNPNNTANSFYTVVVVPTPLPKPPLPPEWAFGVFWGSYHNQTEVLSDMAELRSDVDAPDSSTPVGPYGGDLYWIDSSWLSSSYAGTPQDYICFQFDPVQFPSPTTMVSTLQTNHFHFGVWEWPYVDQGCQYYTTGVNNHYFVVGSNGNVLNGGGWHGNTFTGQFDYTNPAVVAWWNNLNQPLVNMGLNFLKLDTPGTYPTGGVLYDGDNSQDHYETLYREVGYNLTASANGGRGLVLTHTQASTNAFDSPGMWTGDTMDTFPGLIAEMGTASSLNSSNTSAFWCGDTGGYNGSSGQLAPTDELYIRWLEYSTFTPCQEFFGSNQTSTGARFPWMFGLQAQQIALQFNQLRYQLLPFRYSNAQQAYHVSPITYPVWWIGSTQLVNGSGNSQILVQPVTVAGATTASVTLPAGTWIDYWNGPSYVGPGTFTVPAPLNQVPTFILAGSIIPTGPVQQWVGQVPISPLTLEIWPSGNTSYTFYEDDGVSTAYQTGAYSTTLFSSSQGVTTTTITLGATIGTYTGQSTSRNYLLQVNEQTTSPSTVTIAGVTATQYSSLSALNTAGTGWFYDPVALVVWVQFTTPINQSVAVVL